MSIFSPDVVVDNTVLVDGSGVTQPVSGTVTANAGSGTMLVDGSAHTQPISGTVTATGPLTDTQLRATPVPVSSTPVVNPTATVTQVVLTGNTSAQLLAANSARLGVVIYIPSQPAYIKYGATASTTSFTYKITSSASTVTIPAGYTGRIDILSQNGQTVNVTEF